MTGTVEKLVVVITNIDTNDTVERWVFDIITDLPQAGYELCSLPVTHKWCIERPYCMQGGKGEA